MKLPVCKTCQRRGYVWEGPTRKLCQTCEGSGNRPAAGIAIEGERGAEKRFARQEARALYFELHNIARFEDALRKAYCQFCSGVMTEKVDRIDAAHKERRWKGDDSPENICAVHHVCHEWQSQNREAEDYLVTCTGMNVMAGGVIPWPKHLADDLEAYKAKHQ